MNALVWLIPAALLIVAVGTHVVYSVTRHNSAVQKEITEQSFTSEYSRAKILEQTSSMEVASDSGYSRGNATSRIMKLKQDSALCQYGF